SSSARILQALGAAAMIPASVALVLQTFSKEKMPIAVAIWGALGAISGAAGPSLGGLVVETLGWRWAFFINLPVGIFSLLLGLRVLPEGREVVRGRLPDPLGALLLAGGLAVVSYGIVQTESWGWLSVGLLVCTLGGLALIAAFFWRCAKVPNPMLDLRLFESPNFRWANTAMFVYAIAFSASFLGNVLFLTGIWHFSILQAGVGVAPGPLIVAILAPQTGRLAAKYGQRPLLLIGGLVRGSGGLWFFINATATPQHSSIYLPAIALTGCGVALCLPQLSSAALKDLPPDQLGAGSAVGQAIRNLGTTLGVAAAIALIAHQVSVTSFHHIWIMLMTSGVLVSLLAIRLPRQAKPLILPVEPAISATGPSGDR
ncbi:MAG: MFS transporter, partial [Antricoccus sp.]